jgi:poly(A) polymerase
MIKVVKFFKHILKVGSASAVKHKPVIVPRDKHNISRSSISKAALKVLYRLQRAGFSAYLVGGGVRDLLLGLHPKDFDVVTDAHPEQIQRLFSNSYIIGRRFKLVHVRFGNEIIEVATFRGKTQKDAGRVHTSHGLLLRDNVYGTLEDDVWRRDFTVNALYYNIADFSVVDYTGGMQDLQMKIIRVIGDPTARYREDPARMLRAIRLAGKLNFAIELESKQAIKAHKELLQHIPPARLFDKLLKVFHSGKSLTIFELLQEHSLFSMLFSQVVASFQKIDGEIFLRQAFKNTDERINANKSINSSFLFAVILWCPLLTKKDGYLQHTEMTEHQAMHEAMSDVIAEQLKTIAIPRKFILVMREIWQLQYHLEHTKVRRIYKLLYYPRFRAAYDFLVLRCHLEEHLIPLAKWWQALQEGDEAVREKLITERFEKPKVRKRKRKRKSGGQNIHSSGE